MVLFYHIVTYWRTKNQGMADWSSTSLQQYELRVVLSITWLFQVLVIATKSKVRGFQIKQLLQDIRNWLFMTPKLWVNLSFNELMVKRQLLKSKSVFRSAWSKGMTISTKHQMPPFIRDTSPPCATIFRNLEQWPNERHENEPFIAHVIRFYGLQSSNELFL